LSRRRRDQESLEELLKRGQQVREEFRQTLERIEARRLARQARYRRHDRD